MLVIHFPWLIALSEKKELRLFFSETVMSQSYMLFLLGFTEVLENNNNLYIYIY